jgi:hypothetical protein
MGVPVSSRTTPPILATGHIRSTSPFRDSVIAMGNQTAGDWIVF